LTSVLAQPHLHHHFFPQLSDDLSAGPGITALQLQSTGTLKVDFVKLLTVNYFMSATSSERTTSRLKLIKDTYLSSKNEDGAIRLGVGNGIWMEP
jgi:hypothetical protein